jgi:hypothetical protein
MPPQSSWSRDLAFPSSFLFPLSLCFRSLPALEIWPFPVTFCSHYHSASTIILLARSALSQILSVPIITLLPQFPCCPRSGLSHVLSVPSITVYAQSPCSQDLAFPRYFLFPVSLCLRILPALEICPFPGTFCSHYHSASTISLLSEIWPFPGTFCSQYHCVCAISLLWRSGLFQLLSVPIITLLLQSPCFRDLAFPSYFLFSLSLCFRNLPALEIWPFPVTFSSYYHSASTVSILSRCSLCWLPCVPTNDDPLVLRYVNFIMVRVLRLSGLPCCSSYI